MFPAHRLGPTGDVAKANCSTCHQGAYKPLYGASMLKDYPELRDRKRLWRHRQPMPRRWPTRHPRRQRPPEGATVYFAVGSSVLTDEAAKQLDAVLQGLKENTSAKAVISGFHSAAGKLSTNQELAKKRAFAVRDLLKARGIEADRVVLENPSRPRRTCRVKIRSRVGWTWRSSSPLPSAMR